MPLVDLIAGARPNFMKVASIIRAMDDAPPAGFSLDYRLIHTGQHYDAAMSADLFAQLEIPEPDVNLNVGSGTQAEQAGAIMVRYEEVLTRQLCDMCLVVGDVNSTMACSITARKMLVEVGHVEAGLRSGDWTMPEEINRVVTDSIAGWCFTTSRSAGDNLLRTGIPEDRILFVGNTMIDTLLANVTKLRPPTFWTSAGLVPRRYFVLTLHRPSNVDDEATLERLLATIGEAARGEKIIFPVHPRTSKSLQTIGRLPANIICVSAQPYLELNYLVQNARAVITDSGGVTEESTVLGVPCVTLRTTTERPETVSVGTNEIVGSNPAAITSAFDRIFDGRWKKGGIPELWDGLAGERIVGHLGRILNQV